MADTRPDLHFTDDLYDDVDSDDIRTVRTNTTAHFSSSDTSRVNSQSDWHKGSSSVLVERGGSSQRGIQKSAFGSDGKETSNLHWSPTLVADFGYGRYSTNAAIADSNHPYHGYTTTFNDEERMENKVAQWKESNARRDFNRPATGWTAASRSRWSSNQVAEQKRGDFASSVLTATSTTFFTRNVGSSPHRTRPLRIVPTLSLPKDSMLSSQTFQHGFGDDSGHRHRTCVLATRKDSNSRRSPTYLYDEVLRRRQAQTHAGINDLTMPTKNSGFSPTKLGHMHNLSYLSSCSSSSSWHEPNHPLPLAASARDTVQRSPSAPRPQMDSATIMPVPLCRSRSDTSMPLPLLRPDSPKVLAKIPLPTKWEDDNHWESIENGIKKQPPSPVKATASWEEFPVGPSFQLAHAAGAAAADKTMNGANAKQEATQPTYTRPALLMDAPHSPTPRPSPVPHEIQLSPVLTDEECSFPTMSWPDDTTSMGGGPSFDFSVSPRIDDADVFGTVYSNIGQVLKPGRRQSAYGRDSREPPALVRAGTGKPDKDADGSSHNESRAIFVLPGTDLTTSESSFEADNGGIEIVALGDSPTTSVEINASKQDDMPQQHPHQGQSSLVVAVIVVMTLVVLLAIAGAALCLLGSCRVSQSIS